MAEILAKKLNLNNPSILSFGVLKLILAMKISKKISPKQFIISQILILTISLSFLFGLYYILNIQYQASSDPFLYGPVTSKPKTFTLNLNQPADETLYFQSQILISGKTAPGSEVLISTDTDNLVIKSKPDGSFSQSLNLDEGVNNIKVVAFDQTGDTRETEKVIYYSKEKLQ